MTGGLQPINRQPSAGILPCFVSVHPNGRYLLVANYTSGSFAALPFGSDGRLVAATAIVQHEGSGPNSSRQTGAHTHMIVTDPAGRFILVTDLGQDKIIVYQLDEDTGALRPNDRPFAQVAPGAGPRHIAFHSSGRWVFVLNELDSTLTVCSYDAERGSLRVAETLSTLPPDFAGEKICAQVVVDRSGRFVYASNRGHHSIAVFSFDATSGRLALVQRQPSLGSWPRDLVFDPSGTFLLVANMKANTVVTFRVDAQTGELIETGVVSEVPSPSCLVLDTR